MAMANLHLLLSATFLLLSVPVHSLTSPSDIAALKAFKSSVGPSSIPPWSCLASWNFSAADPCALPRRTAFTCGLLCSSSGSPSRITQLTLDPAGYSGTLTPLLSLLTQLTVLDLSDNAFHGPIPSSFSSLSLLQTLALRSNSLSGSLPPSLASLTSLLSLDLSYNSLSGPLPDALSLLSSLTRLDLSFNKFTGALPNKLPRNLLELALKGNSLSGPIRESSFAGLAQLEVVELGHNSLSGTLGAWFFQLPSIQQVDLANNSLKHIDVSKPATGGGGSNLVAIDLGFNRIEGSVPVTFVAYPLLSSLSLRYNRLRGNIPAEFSRKKTLRRLFLDGNYLIGKPPVEFFSVEGPVAGSLGDNCLHGCPAKSQLCEPSQKPEAVCKQAYGGKKPRS